MFATQLLRILETGPSDAKHETCVYDSASQDMIMKENQNVTIDCDSMSFGRDSDPLAVGSKEMYQLTGIRRDGHPSFFEAKGTDECWKPKTEDDLSMESQNRTRDSTAEASQNGPFDRLENLEDDNDLLYKEELQIRSMHDPPVSGEDESGDCRLPYVAASDMFERDRNLFTDKNIVEYDHSELIVCYKEINYHVVKDICVDEGAPASRKILIDSSEDNQPGNCFSGGSNGNDHRKANGAIADELLMSNATLMENTEFILANRQGSRKESNGIKLVTQGWPNFPSENSPYKDTTTGCNTEQSMKKGLTNFGATSKTVTCASDEESFVDRALPIEEFGTRSFLRSFLNSLDGEGNESKRLPDQFSSGKVSSGGPAAASIESGRKEDLQESILRYKSKVETKSITFNFNSLAPAVGDITRGKTELVEEQSLESREVIDKKDAEVDILSESRQVQRSSKDTSPGDIHDQPDRSQAQSASSSNDDEKSAVDLSSKIHQLSSNRSVDPVNSSLQHDDGDPNNDPVLSLRRYDQGDSSFSADDFITHSGPIAFSGSISLRSDGSATSGRSFAFPVLQAEWSSSPVRMTEADRRRFRKHKGWRSGLLCCRF